MRKRANQRGFSLLEAILALLLFALLMDGLFDFFGKTYADYVRFDNKATNINETRAISDFIRNEIRGADEVTIKLADGTIITKGTLMGITLTTLSNITTTTGGMGSVLKLESISGSQNYKLTYNANDRTSLISDQIETIFVDKKKDSQLINFKCQVCKEERKDSTSQKMESTFSESLYYK